MTTNFNIDPNKRGVNGGGLQFSDTIFSATLVALADTTLAVPTAMAMGATCATNFNKFMAFISYTLTTAPLYVALNQAAAVPAAANFTATGSEIVPCNNYFSKSVKSGDVLHFLSTGTPSVTVTFYAIQE